MGNNDKPLGMSGGVPAGEIAKERADWLLDAVAAATQDRRYLRGDPEYNEWAGEAILLNGEKAILVAIDRATPTPPIEGRDADVEWVARRLYERHPTTFYDKVDGDCEMCWLEAAERQTSEYRDAVSNARAALQALGERGCSDAV